MGRNQNRLGASPLATALAVLRTRATTCLGLSALIACAGCDADAINADFQRRQAKALFEQKVDRCLYRMTGPFGSATVEQLRECERRASVSLRGRDL